MYEACVMIVQPCAVALRATWCEIEKATDFSVAK